MMVERREDCCQRIAAARLCGDEVAAPWQGIHSLRAMQPLSNVRFSDLWCIPLRGWQAKVITLSLLVRPPGRHVNIDWDASELWRRA